MGRGSYTAEDELLTIKDCGSWSTMSEKQLRLGGMSNVGL